jgi:hypothetical protein
MMGASPYGDVVKSLPYSTDPKGDDAPKFFNNSENTPLNVKLPRLRMVLIVCYNFFRPGQNRLIKGGNNEKYPAFVCFGFFNFRGGRCSFRCAPKGKIPGRGGASAGYYYGCRCGES